MFAYIDPTIRERLVRAGKLVRIDAGGRPLPPDAPVPPGTRALNVLGPIPLPLRLGGLTLEPRWYAVVRHTELDKVDELAAKLRESGHQARFSELVSHMSVNSALVLGEPHRSPNPLVRVHSSCLTGDVLGSRRCECGPQLEAALARIASDPAGGVLVYMAGHEGRGIGLWAKAVTYLLQDAGEDTYQANRSLGLPDDCRDFSDAAAILLHLLGGNRPFRLLTNNPRKLASLREQGLDRFTTVKHVAGVDETNRRYLRAKRDWGHMLEEADLAPARGPEQGKSGETDAPGEQHAGPAGSSSARSGSGRSDGPPREDALETG